jgi:hypothetical protein
MSSSSRKTYDTDSIVLRRIFAYDISNNSPFSTGYVLTSLTKGNASFLNPLVSLSTIGFSNLPAQVSTISGELFSTAVAMSLLYPSSAQVFLASTVTGLGTSGYISTSGFGAGLASTVTGLGTSEYISATSLAFSLASTATGLGTLGYISTGGGGAVGLFQLYSTVEGLGSAGYLSTSQLVSTVDGLGLYYISSFGLQSTVEGLASAGYISTSQLQSTVTGLASSEYVSSSQLTSSLLGIGNLGFISSVSVVRSTFQNSYTAPWSNAGFLYSNVSATTISLSTIRFDIGANLRSQIIPSTTKLDIELKPNVQFAYYDGTSGNYQFNSLLTRGSTFTTSNVIGIESMTYYILNSNVINLAFFFQEKMRFLITDPSVLSSIRNDTTDTTFALHHTFNPRVPTTNQFFASPASTICATVVLDNTSR